jgi:hypothetical protein
MKSHANILAMDSPSEAARQIDLEQLSVLHSIRRILLYVLVVVPIVVAAVGVIGGVFVIQNTAKSTQSCSYSIYTTHC